MVDVGLVIVVGCVLGATNGAVGAPSGVVARGGHGNFHGAAVRVGRVLVGAGELSQGREHDATGAVMALLHETHLDMAEHSDSCLDVGDQLLDVTVRGVGIDVCKDCRDLGIVRDVVVFHGNSPFLVDEMWVEERKEQ